MLKNILANYLGRFWSTFSNFLFIPIYISLLGINSYSIISFSLVIAGIMAILDTGLSATLSKEFASKNKTAILKFKTFITLETCYFIILILVILFFLIFSFFIAQSWLNLDSIQISNTSYYLKIIGIGVAFQLISNFYFGGLLGLEYQLKANIFQIIWGIVRNGLVVFPLYFFPTLEIFFWWQTICTIIYAIFLRYFLISKICIKDLSIKFIYIDTKILKNSWRFAIGMLMISLIASVNTQLDKLIISKLLPIEKLGFYTLAISLAQSLIVIVNPIATAILPRFTNYYSEQRKNDVQILFKRIYLFISILVFSVAANIVFNSSDLIWIWTGNKYFATQASPFVPYLAFGMSMLSVSVIPYIIALANGFTKLNNIMGLISMLITIPGYWISVSLFGPIGAAITMAFVQCLVTPIYLYFIKQFFLEKESFLSIILHDFIKPLVITFVFSYGFSTYNLFSENRLLQLLWISFSVILTFFISFYFLIPKYEKEFFYKLFPNIKLRIK